jgi:hypothetical protein
MHPLKQTLWLKIGLGETEEYADPVYAECAKRIFPRRKGQITLARRYAMHDDDMSFMREVFMPDTQGNDKPKLPFNQYITEWGLHPMNITGDVDGAMAKMRDKYGESFQCRYSIPCSGGAVFNVSVISGMMFYSRKDAPYEIMGPDMDGDVLPYQTDEDLMVYLAKLVAKAKEY